MELQACTTVPIFMSKIFHLCLRFTYISQSHQPSLLLNYGLGTCSHSLLTVHVIVFDIFAWTHTPYITLFLSTHVPAFEPGLLLHSFISYLLAWSQFPTEVISSVHTSSRMCSRSQSLYTDAILKGCTHRQLDWILAA
jgi:hypothetical protein